MRDLYQVLPDIVFQMLGIGMALAAFLPALVYQYSESLISKIDDSYFKENDIKKILSFVFAVDFILSQSIFLVIFSGLSGIVIYLISTNNIISETLGCGLIGMYLVYGGVVILSCRVIRKHSEAGLKKIWGKISVYKNVWLWILIIYILSSIVFSSLYLYFYNRKCANSLQWLNFILVCSSALLIIAGTCWIAPIIQYRPIMTIIKLSSERNKIPVCELKQYFNSLEEREKKEEKS